MLWWHVWCIINASIQTLRPLWQKLLYFQDFSDFFDEVRGLLTKKSDDSARVFEKNSVFPKFGEKNPKWTQIWPFWIFSILALMIFFKIGMLVGNGQYSGRQRPQGGEELSIWEKTGKQGRNKLLTKKKIFPVSPKFLWKSSLFPYFPLFSLFFSIFLHFSPFFPIFPHFSSLRSVERRYAAIKPYEKQGRNKIFLKNVLGKKKNFWPEYWPLLLGVNIAHILTKPACSEKLRHRNYGPKSAKKYLFHSGISRQWVEKIEICFDFSEVLRFIFGKCYRQIFAISTPSPQKLRPKTGSRISWKMGFPFFSSFGGQITFNCTDS